MEKHTQSTTDDEAFHLFESSKPVVRLAAVYRGHQLYVKESKEWWDLWDRLRPSASDSGVSGNDCMEGIPVPEKMKIIQQEALRFVAERDEEREADVQEFIKEFWPPREGLNWLLHRADKLDADDIEKLPSPRRAGYFEIKEGYSERYVKEDAELFKLLKNHVALILLECPRLEPARRCVSESMYRLASEKFTIEPC